MIQKRHLLVFLLIIVSSSLMGKTYYVSKSGSDSNPGTFAMPWATWQKGFDVIVAGDTLYIRGGVYSMAGGVTRWNLSKDGTAQNKVCVFNYPGEKPILDRTGAYAYAWGHAMEALSINGDYCHVRGLTVRNLWQRLAGDDCFGISVGTSTGVIVENCTAYNIGGSGIIIGGATNLSVINCDVYNCNDKLGDPEMPGQDGYGFNVNNVYVPSGSVTFTKCRAWKCGDDGFTLYSVGYVEFIGCWSFSNGLLDGGGNGFKLSFMPPGPFHSNPLRVIKNCVAAYNKNAGITTNDNNTKAVTFNAYNNTLYKNGYGIMLYNTLDNDATENLRVFRNNNSYGNIKSNIFVGLSATYTHSYNTWDKGVTVTNDDFISVDTTGLTAVRQNDGSLPNNPAYTNFLRLANGSDLIDAGVNVGLPYVGSAPDLGWSEYNSTQVISAPVYVSSVIANSTPSILEMTYSSTLANIVPAATAFTVQVNSVTRTVNSVSISGTKVLLTLSIPVVYGNTVTVAYTKPATNPLQTSSGGQVASFTAKPVLNNCIQSTNQPPVVSISSPINNSTFKAPGTINITADAIDTDGTINKVQFFSGNIKIGEATKAPYSVIWQNVPLGKYSITAVASDNLLSTSVSNKVEITVRNRMRLTKGAPEIRIIEPADGKHFIAPATIDVRIESYDPDSIITKVEYFIGSTKIGERFQAPYPISFEGTSAGSHKITSIAYDELDDIVYSTLINVYVDEIDPINLYPNPNDGHFSVVSLIPIQNSENVVNIVNSAGKIVYQGNWLKEDNTRYFDLSHLDPGIYIMIIKRQEILFTKKFIKK